MITTSNGNVYTLYAIQINTDDLSASICYHVSNPLVTAVGGSIPNTTFDVTTMPQVQATFSDPLHNGLPLFPVLEQWLVSTQSAAAELIGGTIS